MAGIEVHLLPLTFPEPPPIVVHDEIFLIGRESQIFSTWKDARLKRLSREHARLQIRGDAASLCDLGSSNGTKINNVPLLAYQAGALRDGDVVNFANVLKYEVKIVRHQSPEDTVITRGSFAAADDDRIVKDQTLFIASSDSYLDMLCDEGESAEESIAQPVSAPKSRHWIIIAAAAIFAIGAALAWSFIDF